MCLQCASWVCPRCVLLSYCCPYDSLLHLHSFVGVAFRIGTVLKISFYACAEAAASGHYQDSHQDSCGRQLAASGSCGADPLYRCTGAVIGVWHGLGPFLCMYLLWQIETSYRARYSASSKVHTACDIVTNLLLLLAGMNLGPVPALLRKPPLPASRYDSGSCVALRMVRRFCPTAGARLPNAGLAVNP